MRLKDRLIVSLDLASLDDIAKVSPVVNSSIYKVGLRTIYSDGLKSIFNTIPSTNVFLDCKLNDIPSTIGSTVNTIANYKPKMFNVMASGGMAMMQAAVANKQSSEVYAVTILTSIDDNECQLLYGATSSAKVIQYARNAKLAGCDGIVCSPLDLPTIKALPELQGLKTIVPGISIYGHVDQKRTATPYYALENGADYIVVGRDILNATNKEAALFDTYRWMYKGLCQRLILTLFNNNHVKFGQFKLKLHEKNPDAPLSPLYLNLRQMNNTILDMITDLMIDIIEDDNITFDAIAGIPKAGTPIAELLADKLQIPHITLSKVEKDDGTRYISGVVTKLNATKVLLVDDLITGADTKLEAIKVLEKENYKVTDLLVTVDRQQGGVTQLDSLGYKTYTVIKLANLLDGLFNANKISINQYEDTRDYLKLPKLAG